ncbi:hypothetical protein EHZ47_21665 [Aeromonas jandaei]|uniref:hypothetical protein n=1 Tax=Aeromonas jandaei TaxID=650 RepID=UPI000F523462|nr:hypothetical protein [Aeromonas jandaei]RQM70566.1 hypothetical protein EHZ47_21665 [Aeromonas jandaei]
MNKYISFMFFFSVYANAGAVVQGPYKITGDTATIRVEENSGDINCPFSLVISKVSASYELDKVCENGDKPNIRSVFFMSLKGVTYIATIVSWYNKHQAEGIDETNFEVKIYRMNEHGQYTLDEEKTSDAILSGTEDSTGDGSYKYNNATAVKRYMKKKYG